MNPPAVDFLREAVEEAQEARAWYAQRSERAAERFVEELDHAIDQIRQFPARWPDYLHGTRRFLFNRFPYLVVYRVRNDRIQVIACQHGSRRPGYWRHRLER